MHLKFRYALYDGIFASEVGDVSTGVLRMDNV